MASACDINDNFFGPIIHGCRSNFDFTLLFEQAILSIPPAALLLLLTPPRLRQLLKSREKTFPTPIRTSKSVSIIAELETLI
jgi:ATP-binding cassette subfamily C (CFTR/MRP) protein 1